VTSDTGPGRTVIAVYSVVSIGLKLNIFIGSIGDGIVSYVCYVTYK